MDARECLELLRRVKDVTFSTVDERGLPQARIIDVMLVEEGRLYFLTARGKDFYRQLEANPHVAVTGLDKATWQTVRLMGEARHLDDRATWIGRMFEANPSMYDVYPGESSSILEPFVIEAGEVEFFDLSHEPIDRASLSIGGAAPRRAGFVIGEECIGCGTCLAGCPQQCIEEGAPFLIHQDHCLHCGLCLENCPVQAIVRREDVA